HAYASGDSSTDHLSSSGRTEPRRPRFDGFAAILGSSCGTACLVTAGYKHTDERDAPNAPCFSDSSTESPRVVAHEFVKEFVAAILRKNLCERSARNSSRNSSTDPQRRFFGRIFDTSGGSLGPASGR